MSDWIVWIQLAWEFFKTGLFAVGGGLATIPFLTDMMNRYHWFTYDDLMNMIAVGESTPGPIGINMATYVGYHVTHNVLGGVTTTVALVLPSMIIICIIARFLQMFKSSHWVQDVFYGLRPAVAALIATAGLGVFETTMMQSGSFFDGEFFVNVRWLSLFIFAALLAVTLRWKKLNPILIIVFCGVMGIILQL